MSMIKLIALEKVIIMTNDWVKNLLEKNPDLTLPIIVNSSKEVFQELNRKWDIFLSLLSREKELESCIEPAEFSIKKINEAKDLYYSGNFGQASECMHEVVCQLQTCGCNHLVSDLDSLFVDNEAKHWFRGRKGTLFPFDKGDMKHVPTDKREAIGSNRYSFNGIPCLYLANSILTCWEELDRPAMESFWVSRFWPIKKIRVLNLSTTGFEIIYAQSNIKYVSQNPDEYENAVIEFFKTWVLQSACSVNVKDKGDRSFREEYIIPQLLMLNIQKFNVDGVMYFSTKTPISIDNKTIALNFQSATSWISKAIAIPAFDAQDSRFSKTIDEKFRVSLPINVGMYQNRLAVSPAMFIPRDTNWSRTHAPAYVSLVPTTYELTSFYRCENELFQEAYQLELNDTSDSNNGTKS